MICVHSFSLSREVEPHPMAQDRRGEGLDILKRGPEASAKNGPGLGAGDQVETGSWTATPGDKILDEARSVLLGGTRSSNQCRNILEDMVSDGNPADEILKQEKNGQIKWVTTDQTLKEETEKKKKEHETKIWDEKKKRSS